MKKIHENEPLIRVTKREELARMKVLILRISVILIALICGGVFLALIGQNPFKIYETMWQGATRSKMAREATIKLFIPLTINALGVTLAFKMKFWNIGAEGQMIMGGVFASYFAIYHDGLNHWVLILVMFLAGMVGGGLFALIPAIFKAKFNVNETLFTLMLNYVALYLVVYLQDGPWRDPSSLGFAKFPRFSTNAQLDKVLGVQFGWIVALILVVLVFIYMKYTKHGYEISVVGESQATAKYAGMNVKKIILRTMFISGAICGLAGMIEATGTSRTLTTGIAGGVGFTAIIVAWLSQLNPIVIMIVAAFFSIMDKGSSLVQSTFHVSSAVSAVLQGIILFMIIGSEFFIKYRFVLRQKRSPKQETEEA